MYKKTFSASLDQLHAMLDFIQFYVKEKGVPLSLWNKITLAAEEALVNIIHYGYPDKKGSIEIACEETEKKPGICILIKDYGIPFNPIVQASIKEREQLNLMVSLGEEPRVGGYGIDIFVGIMDCVEYKRINGENILALIKYL